MATINMNIFWIPFLYITSITSTEYDCTWSHGNASFDLCPWKKTVNTQGDLGYWEVYDDRDSYADNYTYKFNICADIVNTNQLNNLCTNNTARQAQSPPLPIGYCSDIVNGTNECKCLQTSANHTCLKEAIKPIDIDTAAYQMPRRKSWKDCYRLHNGITPPKFALIDSDDPTVGVSLKYGNGDWCPAFGV